MRLPLGLWLWKRTIWESLLLSITHVCESPTSIVDNLVGAHEKVVHLPVDFQLGLSFVSLPDLTLLIASPDVVNEEAGLDGVDDL